MMAGSLFRAKTGCLSLGELRIEEKNPVGFQTAFSGVQGRRILLAF